jgi:hypothetical protein
MSSHESSRNHEITLSRVLFMLSFGYQVSPWRTWCNRLWVEPPTPLSGASLDSFLFNLPIITDFLTAANRINHWGFYCRLWAVGTADCTNLVVDPASAALCVFCWLPGSWKHRLPEDFSKASLCFHHSVDATIQVGLQICGPLICILWGRCSALPKVNCAAKDKSNMREQYVRMLRCS